MNWKRPWLIALALLCSISTCAQERAPAAKPGTSPHTVQFVTVDKDAELEVLAKLP